MLFLLPHPLCWVIRVGISLWGGLECDVVPKCKDSMGEKAWNHPLPSRPSGEICDKNAILFHAFRSRKKAMVKSTICCKWLKAETTWQFTWKHPTISVILCMACRTWTLSVHNSNRNLLEAGHENYWLLPSFRLFFFQRIKSFMKKKNDPLELYTKEWFVKSQGQNGQVHWCFWIEVCLKWDTYCPLVHPALQKPLRRDWDTSTFCKSKTEWKIHHFQKKTTEK